MDDWLVVFGDPFSRANHVFAKYVNATNFDEAVKEGRKQWLALVSGVESSTGKFVPGVGLLMVAYDPEHKIGEQYATRD